MTFLSNAFAVALATFAVAWTGLVFTGGAQAEPAKTFKVELRYNADGPAESTYATIQRQATSACRREARRARPSFPLTGREWARSCADDVVGKAVAKIGAPDLLALHDKSSAARQVAAR